MPSENNYINDKLSSFYDVLKTDNSTKYKVSLVGKKEPDIISASQLYDMYLKDEKNAAKVTNFELYNPH